MGSKVKLTGNLAEQKMREAKRNGTLKRKGYVIVRNIARDNVQMDRLIKKQGLEVISGLWRSSSLGSNSGLKWLKVVKMLRKQDPNQAMDLDAQGLYIIPGLKGEFG